MGLMKLMFIFIGVLFFGSVSSFGKSIPVSSAIEFAEAQKHIQTGDSIIWRAGTYKNIHLELLADGISLLAESPGATIFSGSSAMKISGSGNMISGFQFIGGKIEHDVVDIQGSSNKIENINIQSYDSHYYLRVRPNCQYNKISYCNFEGKPETQESSVVQIEATDGLPGYHVLSHCTFLNHTAPQGAGGDFGIEALRIGYSYQRTFISRTIVEYCYFEKCNGDYEVISNKACENLLRYNTFINNGPAHLTQRHGSRAMVYGNFFINGAGIRIKEGQNHAVINNYFDTGDRFSINIQNHHFDPVDTVNVQNNTFISHKSMELGGEGEFQPKNVLLANNLFAHEIDTLFSDPTGTETWMNNVLHKGADKLEYSGFKRVSYNFSNNVYALSEPAFNSYPLEKYETTKGDIFDIPELEDDFKIQLDIMKQKRVGKYSDIPGCFLPEDDEVLKYYATKKNTGPVYLR